jgi:hypothetical protein
MVFADNIARGTPPPGWTLPPTKYKPLIFEESFACRKKAALEEFEALPYKAPK